MTARESTTSIRDRDNFIQIWRGIAVLLVVYYHFSNRLPPNALGFADGPTITFYSGKVGVLIFFVISGYLIALSLSHSQNLARFYAKRISRIWPLFILASITIFAFLHFFDPPIVSDGPKRFFAERRSWIDLLGSLFFLEDIGFRWMDGVFWSVLVELKYYFWIGLLAWFNRNKFGRNFAILAIILSVPEMLIGLWAPPELAIFRTVLNGFFIAQYLPYFAIGTLLATKTNDQLLIVLLILAVLQAAMKSGANADFDMHDTAAFGLVLASVVLLDACLTQSRIFLHLGHYSYGFYLFHQMIGLTIIKSLSGLVSYDVAIIVALLATYAIAMIASWLVEWRFRALFISILTRLFSLFGANRLSLKRVTE